MNLEENQHRDLIWRFAVYITATLTAIIWTMAAGKDLTWDALHYHLYAGFSAVHDRSGLDYFAAGPQTYLNPYAHVPLYLMVSAGWPAIAIGSAFACLHAVNAWLSYELTASLNTRADGSISHGIALLGVILVLLNPVFLGVVGSTFTDTSTAIPVLGGWLLLAKSFFKPRLAMLVLSGALLGSGTALKLSNAIYAVAALPIVLFLPGSLLWRGRAFLLLCLGNLLGFAVVGGDWAWQMWKSFGNPFFPLFNQIFHSPFFTAEVIKDHRFVPTTFLDGLLRPFEMAEPLPGIHVEVRAPDSRYAILALLLPCWLLIARYRKSNRKGRHLYVGPFSESSDRALTGVIATFVAAWTIWLSASGNSRYFLPMACIAGVVLASIMARLFGGSKRSITYAVIIVLLVQSFQLYFGGTARWGGNGRWTGQWYQVSIPARFKSEPALYFSTDTLSGSFFLPFLAEGSGMINSSGQFTLAGSGPSSQPIYRLIEKNYGHMRILTEIGGIRSDGSPIQYTPEMLDPLILRFGLRTDATDCVVFSAAGGVVPTVTPTASEHHVDLMAASAKGLSYYQSCHLVAADPAAVKSLADEQTGVDRVFDNVEDACPQLFQPRRVISLKWSPVWKRFYPSTSMQISIRDGYITFQDTSKHGDPIPLGREEDWTGGPKTIDCSKKYTLPWVLNDTVGGSLK